MDVSSGSSPHADPLLGELVAGRYRVLRVIGEGGMGRVYEAVHEALDKRVAIKTLARSAGPSGLALERFRQEARLAASVRDAHVVDVTDFGVLDDGSPFMVMALLEGRDLATVLAEEGALDVARAVRIARQICAALEAAHAQGIVHGDLSPTNVLLVTEGDDPDFVKVVDFGLSRMGGAPPPRPQTGAAIGPGTLRAMAPEQIEGREVTPRTDVHALGVLLYRALTGNDPFDAESPQRLVYRILVEEPIPPSELREDVPEALSRVVRRALAKHPDDRFWSARALGDALARAMADEDALAMEDDALSETSNTSLEGEPMRGSDPGSVLGADLPLDPSHREAVRALARKGRMRARTADLMLALASALAFAASLVVGVVVARARTEATRVASRPAPVRPSPAASASTDDGIERASMVAPRARDVSVLVSVSPSCAVVEIDGVHVPNHAIHHRAPSPGLVRVRAACRGYEPVETVAELDRDAVIELTLRRAVRAPTPTRARAGSPESGAAQGDDFLDEF